MKGLEDARWEGFSANSKEAQMGTTIKEKKTEKLEKRRKRISDKRTENEAKNDKTEHGMEKHEVQKSKSIVKVKSQRLFIKFVKPGFSFIEQGKRKYQKLNSFALSFTIFEHVADCEELTDSAGEISAESAAYLGKVRHCRGITSITVNGKAAYELKGRFLDDLRENAFSGTNGEDAVEHIKYFLKIVDPIDLPNVANQEVLTNEGFLDLEKANNNDEHKFAKIFRIETNLFDYETPLFTKFNEFNYLLKIDTKFKII
ncbi:hypothetical protein Tco_0481549 [Tanacetum coccineum]